MPNVKSLELPEKSAVSDYYQDLSIPTTDQASHEDYKNSEWAVGNYLFPFSKYEAAESDKTDSPNDDYLFSLTSPQDKNFHNGFWKLLRKRPEVLAQQKSGVFSYHGVVILSRPLFLNISTSFLEPGHIPVPSHFFQAIAPSSEVKDIEVYIVPNIDISSDTPLNEFRVTLEEFETKSGIKGIEALGNYMPSAEGPVPF